MQRSMMLISIQHELGMSIGLEAELKPMLRRFLGTAIRRLNLCAAHVYLRIAPPGEVADGAPSFRPVSGARHLVSLPGHHYCSPMEDRTVVEAIDTLAIDSAESFRSISAGDHHYHLFAITDIGVIVLERRHEALAEDIVKALLPVMERLTVACRAAYEHEAILSETRQRQYAQRALIASETRFRTVLDHIIDAIVTTDAHGTIESANPATLALFGYEAQELIGANLDLLIDGEARRDGGPSRLIDNTHTRKQWMELAGVKKSGERFAMEVSVEEMVIEGERLHSVIIRDVSERKRYEEHLKLQLRFAKAFTDIAELLVQEDSATDIMDGVSTIVGETLAADRALIYDIDFSAGHALCLSEWINPDKRGIQPTKVTFPLRMFRSGCRYIFETRHWLESHANLIDPHLVEDGSGRMFHQQMGIKSLFWYPFQFRDDGYYLLVFHQVERTRRWQSEEIDFLNAVAQHISMALKKTALMAERDRALEDLRLAATAFDAQEAMFITDANATIQRVNKAFTAVTGYTEEEVVGKNPRILKSNRHDKAFYKKLWQALEEQGYWRGEIWNRRKNGEIYPEWQTITSVKNEKGEVTHYISSFQDMTEYKLAEARIERLAYYDSLTGLPNRTLLLDRLQHELNLTRRNNKHGALLFLDLDRFKTINDALGHSIGDALLSQVAERIAQQVRNVDTVARLGGDEFVVLLAQLSDSADEAGFAAQVVAEKIRAALCKPYRLQDHEYQFTPSIGIALFPENNDTVDDVLKHADASMYLAKSHGGNAIRFYKPDMQVAADERLALEKDLRRAIANDELELYYQPQVDQKGRIIGAEALIRWHHPERGTVSPHTFIPLAEETGQVLELGHWVMRHAFEQIRRWHDSGLCQLGPTFAINVSPRQFHQSDFVPQVTRLIKEAGIAPESLKLEITENIVMADVEDTIQKMEELRRLGVVFSIDDFGTGYSSLAYLKQLPLSQIKIDRSFVLDITSDPNDAMIVETIISMARHMNLDVLAEGVETAGQLSYLQQQGCYSYQGFYFSKPLPAGEFQKLLERLDRGDTRTLQPA